jgi:cell wall assembly regulator SMI1
MRTVTESWQAIGDWLAEHAPVTAGLLLGPADLAEIIVAEKRIGLRFPDELVESLTRHDGLTTWTTSLLPIAWPLSVAAIVETYETRMRTAADVGGFAIRPDRTEPWWHPQWIPFGDEEGNTQVIDLRPGAGHGRLGSARNHGTGEFTGGWPSLAAYLDNVADVLANGGQVDVWQPYLAGAKGELWWDLSGATHAGRRRLRRPAGHQA